MKGSRKPRATSSAKATRARRTNQRGKRHEAGDGSFFSQLVLRGETSFTPNKRFTDGRLSADWIEADEWTASIIAEKWWRWSNEVPGMFMVAEWMFKSESDLLGRHLSRNETNPSTDLTGCTTPNSGRNACDNQPKGSDSFNAVVFAFQQPFPDLIWRLDMAFLMDLEGGWFFQPGIRYRPSASFQFDVYANIAQDGGDKGDDIIETFDFADEVFVRATYLDDSGHQAGRTNHLRGPLERPCRDAKSSPGTAVETRTPRR